MFETRRSATAFALALSSLVALPARAQELEPPAVKPVHVETGVPGLEAESWDGRIMISNCFMDHDPNRFGWVACVFRPERVVRRADGTPDFSQGAFSDGKGSDVGGVPLEFDSAPNTGMGPHQTIALCRRPGFDEDPFRSRQDGTPDPSGAYETYEATVITPFVNPPDGSPPTVGMRHARFVVSSPRTKDASLVSATMLDSYSKLHAVNGQEIRGIEPSVTADGRLIVYQGHPKNDGSIDILMYTYNATPDRTDGWSVPKCLVEMNGEAKTLVDGIPFAERFPIAKAPLRASDGTVFASGELLHGAYPWVAHDGTEVFYTATIAGTPGVDQARRGGESVIGRWTGNQARHIDGPINMDRSKTVRLIVSSPGAKPSFWSPYPDVKDGAIPYTAARPVFPLFTGTQHDYDEISFEDFVDQDYVVALHMNEVVTKSGDYDSTRTQDTSGNFNTGKLEGARFPQEYDGGDELRGVVGQGIYFGDKDLVRVKDAPSLHGGPSLSVQLWVKRLVDLAQGTSNEFRFLAGKPGSWDMILEQDGHLHVLVAAGGKTRDSGIVGTTVPVGEWTSVAFTYDGATGTLRTYQRGVKVGEVVTGPGAVDSSTQDLLVGPAGRQPPAAFVPAGQAVFLLDELLVSRVVRTDAEISRAAFRDVGRAPLTASVAALPLGLDAADLRIPASASQGQDAVDLGRMLFFDVRLSGPRTMSCATCHDPAKSFTDGKARSNGANGGTLRRNAPSIANRAFGTLQFLDGRAGSLEEQALAPIQNPDEMAGDLPTVVSILSQIPDYVARFNAAFGAPPSADGIARAIAAFERTVLSGSSAADRFEAGDRTALGPSEQRGRLLFRGKARCSACHTGSNFSDESFHATQQTTTTDQGRQEVTGRRRFLDAFKTPSLRDVALTAPYLNDGSAATLEDVIDNYDKGGLRVDDRDPELRPLGLTASEKADLAAYLRSLTGTTVNVSAPSLPADPPGLPAPTVPPPPRPSAPPPPPPAPAPAAPPAQKGGGFFGGILGFFKHVFGWL